LGKTAFLTVVFFLFQQADMSYPGRSAVTPHCLIHISH